MSTVPLACGDEPSGVVKAGIIARTPFKSSALNIVFLLHELTVKLFLRLIHTYQNRKQRSKKNEIDEKELKRERNVLLTLNLLCDRGQKATL
ncbi:MAG: hypothetical protein ACREX3_10855, partial [Gammaproteobacteria bacterium]